MASSTRSDDRGIAGFVLLSQGIGEYSRGQDETFAANRKRFSGEDIQDFYGTQPFIRFEKLSYFQVIESEPPMIPYGLSGLYAES